jgi:hypothetical protein
MCACAHRGEERFESHESAISSQMMACILSFFFSLAPSTNSL